MEEAVATATFSCEKTMNDAAMGKIEKWIMHYCSAHKILLVGEGNFSFSACLARAFGSAENMVATSLDTEGDLLNKYWDSAIHLGELKRLGCMVLHGIDVQNMHENHFLKEKKFDRIIFNFPHAGHYPGLDETKTELILKHRKLLCNLFSSARCLLSECGEIHVSHRDDKPYVQWEIRTSAEERGLFLKEMAKFELKDYPGYHNKRGGDIKSGQTFPLGDSSFTFKFSPRKNGDISMTRFKKTAKFELNDYPGYRNKKGEDIKNNETFPPGKSSFTFKFSPLKNGDISMAKFEEMDKFELKDYQNKKGGDIKSNETFPLGNSSFTFKFSPGKNDDISMAASSLMS